MRFQMYQTGYLRRSFRSPENRELYFINQLNFLVSAIPQIYTYGEYPDYTRTFYDPSVSEQLRLSQYLQQNQMFRVWSAAIDSGNAEILKQAEDIIYNKDEIGKVTRELIKTLLNSEKKEAWELVEKLLLAAQRQEGLRQTILEARDETSIGALKYMINVIVSKKLARFSSVVRAVDVWAGLGWESEREKTVATFLEKAHEFLEYPENIPAAVKSANNTNVYMALWSQGVFDVEKCQPFLNELYEKGNAEKRALALKFAIEARHYRLDTPLFEKALDDSDTMVLAWALTGINNLLPAHNGEQRDFSAHPALFDNLHQIIRRIDTKEKTYDGKIFAWTRIVFNRNEALKAMIDLIGEDDARLETVLSYFEEMSVDLREKLTRRVLPEHAIYGWQEKDEKQAKSLTKFQHDYAFRILADKGEFVRATGFRALDKAAFSAREMDGLQNLLKRKGADFRGKIIQLLLKQSDDKLKDSTAQLLSNGDAEQRLAGLDILLQLKKNDRLKTETQILVENFRDRKSVSQKEEILLSQLEGSHGDAQKYSAENGYGLYAVEKSVSPVIEPKVNPENIYEKRTSQDSAIGKVLDKAKSWIGGSAAKHKYGFSVPLEEVVNQLQKLADLYLENKNYEYEVENWNNTKASVLLGNTFRNKKYQFDFETPEAEYSEYPLPEVWERWFQSSGLDAGDLYLVQLSKEQNSREMIPTYNEVVPKEFTKYYYYNNPLYQIVHALQKIHPFAEKNEFMLGCCARLFASLDEKFLKAKSDEKAYSYQHTGDGWQIRTGYQTFYNAVNVPALEERSVKDFWNLAHWRQYSGRKENIPFCAPSLATFARAFQLGIIGEDEMYRGIMRPENIAYLSARKIKGRKDFDYYDSFPFLREMFEKAREHILDIELKRGDSPTSVTRMASNLNTVYGINRLAEILVGLGKTTLSRGYHYYYGDNEINKQTQFSRLLKNCYPREADMQEAFNRLMKQSKISEAKLIEAAVYAPQWQKYISSYLNWKGLDSAIWWMHAHTKIAGYREQTPESESEIARYSAVDLQDFKDGAVDKDWFLKAYKEIGKARWEMVYNAAKYISDGNGHRRARLYADVISGTTKIKEITDRIKTKRDQDYLRMYGLVPLNKKNPEKDVLARYEYLQKFKKESRQFGAQKQTSEALAIRIALENLARNAGYADPIRLTWAMESKQVQEIFAAETQFQKDNISVRLVVDAEGKADIVVSKGEKELKSVPPKYKKEKKIAELNEHKKRSKNNSAVRAGGWRKR